MHEKIKQMRLKGFVQTCIFHFCIYGHFFVSSAQPNMGSLVERSWAGCGTRWQQTVSNIFKILTLAFATGYFKFLTNARLPKFLIHNIFG
jgi:hypothetical protein